MRNKAFSGDFGYTPDYYPNDGMGDWFSDLTKNLNTQIQTYTKSFEAQASDWLKLQTQSLPPDVRAQLESEIKKGGVNTVDQLKAMAQQKLMETAQAQAQAKLKDPAVQNTAISATVEATAKELSNNLISLKDLLIQGKIVDALKKHPALFGIPVGIASILAIKFGIRFAKYTLDVKSPKVKSNPFVRKDMKKRKFKIKRFK